MRSFSHLTTFMVALVSYVHAQTAENCGVSSSLQFINASVALTIRDPFRTPTGIMKGGSSSWTWKLATASNDMTGPRAGSVEQRLYLETESYIDLQSPSLGFLGCGAVLHGLTHDALAKGQNDDGSCNSLLSPACITALAASATQAAMNSSTFTAPGSSGVSALILCNNLAFTIPPVCGEFFEKSAWIQSFVFASPEISTMCPGQPSASTVDAPLTAWGAGTYQPKAMTTYDNLTTAISPLITTMSTNLTATDASAWVSQHLSCLRPKDISQGSVNSNDIPNDKQAAMGPSGVAANAANASGSATGSRKASKNAAESKVTFMMDWLSLLVVCIATLQMLR